ncbi:MAG: hypothetical protein ACK5IC_07600 [Moheibacter sp.]
MAWLVHNAGVCVSKGFKYAAEYGFDTYKKLKALTKGKGLEVHHLIEKRFAGIFKPPQKARDMMSMVLTKEEHQIFTNAWRKAIPYGQDYASNYSEKEIKKIAKDIYKDYPEILKTLGL